MSKYNCKICNISTILFFKLKNFPLNTINNRQNFANLSKNLKLRFCKKCKNISTYPIISNKILYNNFYKKNFKFKDSKKFTKNFINKNKLKSDSKILEISKHNILDKKFLNNKNIYLQKINIIALNQNLSKIKNDSIDYIFCYDFIGNVENIEQFLNIIRNKINNNGIIYFHHNYGPSLLKKISLDRVYFEHKNFLSITAISKLVKNSKMIIKKIKLIENKNFFEIEISKLTSIAKNYNLDKILKEEKKITYFLLKKFRKLNQKNIKKLKFFLKKNLYHNIFGIGASIATVPLIINYNLHNILQILFDDYPISKKFYFRDNFYRVLNLNSLKKFRAKKKIIIIFATRYFLKIKKKIIKYLNKEDIIIRLTPKFIYYKKS